MNKLSVFIKPQYVKQTDVKERFPDGKEHPLHLVQKRMKLDFESFPYFIILTAPTGTGKSYSFPFPVLNSIEKNGKHYGIRGLIVLPTNALIEELTINFQKTYSDLNIIKITGKTLDALLKKGFNRWTEILELCAKADLVITNPDIINYAMHGGYHKNKSDFWKNKTGRREFVNFLEKFTYIIFDEYHLYDESQIANIWTLIKLRDLFLQDNNKIKYLFASATPEKELKIFLEEQNCKVEEIIEEITSDNKNARAIHGRLEVEFHLSSDIQPLIDNKLEEIEQELKRNIKVLLILNNLRAVQILAKKLTTRFPNSIIYQSTGYGPKEEDHNEKIKNANIIVATNKAEVGVNYGIEYCIMQTGKFFQNFVQRFGRVSRGDLEGKVIIGVDNIIFNKIQKCFQDSENLDYYSFIERIRNILQSKNFYSKIIPFYYGEYIWCIKRNIRYHQSYNTRTYFNTQLSASDFFKQGHAYSRYKLLSEIDQLIQEMRKRYGNGPITKQWYQWWENYLTTYLSFRDASKIVVIIDKDQNIETRYSLDWILQNKEILDIQVEEKGKLKVYKYIVGALKEKDKDIEYTVTTIPNIGAKENDFLSYDDIVNDKNLKRYFKKAIVRVEDRVRKGIEPIDELQRQLIQKLKLLELTFNKKRLKIDNIEGNDEFL